MRNPFKAGNATVNIEGGFIPHGKEYVRLKEVIAEKAERKGSFRMQFNNRVHRNAVVLEVKFSKHNQTA